MQFLSIISAIASLLLQGSVCATGATVVEEVVGQVAATIEESGSLNHARIPTAVSDVLAPPVAHAIPLGRPNRFNSLGAHGSELDAKLGFYMLEKSPPHLLFEQLEQSQQLKRQLVAALEHDPKAASASLVRLLEYMPWTEDALVRASLIDQTLARALERGAAVDHALERMLESVRPRVEAEYLADGLFIVEKEPYLLAQLERDQTLRSKVVVALEHDPQQTAAYLAAALEKFPWMADVLVRASLKDQALVQALAQASILDESLAESVERVPALAKLLDEA